MKTQRILSAGSINMDLIMTVSRFPRPGENVFGGTYGYFAGGKGANQAVAAQLQGAVVTFAGKVGDDVYGDRLRTMLKGRGINTDFLFKDTTKPSGLAVIMIDDTGNNRIISFAESNMAITDDEISSVFSRNYDFLMLQFEINADAVIKACEKARSMGIPYVIDAGPAMDFPLERIAGMEILSPNETEAEALCGVTISSKDTAEKAARLLFNRARPRYVVQKLGENGAMLFDGTECQFFPALKVDNVVDPTAAGDVFTAAMTVQYATHRDIRRAVSYANVAGALAVTRIGAQDSIPTAQETAAFANINGGRSNNV